MYCKVVRSQDLAHVALGQQLVYQPLSDPVPHGVQLFVYLCGVLVILCAQNKCTHMHFSQHLHVRVAKAPHKGTVAVFNIPKVVCADSIARFVWHIYGCV